MSYLQNKEKFRKYRVVAEVDKDTNDFPRDEHGSIDKSYDDIFIRCSNKNMIYSYGKGTLVAYIPSTIRGKNILKLIGSNIPFDIEETDEEILFKFKYKDLDEVATLLKAHKNPKDKQGNYHYISPYSVKNLPRTKVNIPDDKLTAYKNITAKIDGNSMLIIKDINNKFIKSLASKSNTIDNIKSDMRLKGAKGKEYFYIIGKMDDYLRFLEKRVGELNE